MKIPKYKPPFTIIKQTVVAKTRQIGPTWTIEQVQDGESYINPNLEDQLAEMINKELEKEK